MDISMLEKSFERLATSLELKNRLTIIKQYYDCGLISTNEVESRLKECEKKYGR